MIFVTFCAAIKCPELLITNGRVSYAPDMNADFNLGTVATYICNSGFELTGNASRTCVNTSHTTAEWDRETEFRKCVDSGSVTAIATGSTLGAIVLVLFSMIVITIVILIVLRKRKVSSDDQDLYVDGHIYDDPNLLHFKRPSLPCRNVTTEDNQAYIKTFEMTDNNAYGRKRQVEATVSIESGSYIEPDEVEKPVKHIQGEYASPTGEGEILAAGVSSKECVNDLEVAIENSPKDKELDAEADLNEYITVVP